MDVYRTLAGEATAQITEKRSVFISSVRPVSTEDEAAAFVAEVQKKYSDARHNVYAYVLRAGCAARFSDNGEPHGTAGLPTLDVLRKNGIFDADVVTTRYFGGLLLGTGGLVRAYTQAAALAVEKAGITVVRPYSRFSLRLSYPDYGRLMPSAERTGIIIDRTEYGDSVTVFARVPEEFERTARAALTELFGGRVEINMLESVMMHGGIETDPA